MTATTADDGLVLALGCRACPRYPSHGHVRVSNGPMSSDRRIMKSGWAPHGNGDPDALGIAVGGAQRQLKPGTTT